MYSTLVRSYRCPLFFFVFFFLLFLGMGLGLEAMRTPDNDG